MANNDSSQFRRRMGGPSNAPQHGNGTKATSLDGAGSSPQATAADAHSATETVTPARRRRMGGPTLQTEASTSTAVQDNQQSEEQAYRPTTPRRMGSAPVTAPAAVQSKARPDEPAAPDLISTPLASQTQAQERSLAMRRILPVVGVILLGLIVVLVARWLRTLSGMESFINEYPGHTALRETAPVGIPGWVGWQHFFNMFLIVLIVRTGLQVRLERRPPGYWTPKKGSFFSPGRQAPTKVSLTQWLHQSLDVLWILNGLIFIVLLFATGHWMRIVPTSWDIFPHMLSAGIQYASLDWPLEHGWVHYNALQVMAYFLTVFVAAPLAIISGLRISTWWPKENQFLSKAYPVEVARSVHLPVMIYFVAFTIVHVFLVFFTGALRNLNHMYTSRDVVDGWGLVIFLSSLIVIAAGWMLTKQIFMRPVASTMGKVSKN